MKTYSKYIFLMAMTLLFYAKSYGQGLCDRTDVEKGGFDIIGNATDCGPLKLELNNTSGISDVKYFHNYKEQSLSELSDEGNTPFYPSDPNGGILTYTILQYGKKNGKDMIACKKVTVHPQLSFYPEFCSGSDEDPTKGQLVVNFPDQQTIDGFSFQFQIGNKTVDVGKLPFRYPEKGAYSATLNDTLKVYAINKQGVKICEQKPVLLKGGDENPTLRFISKLEMISGTEVKLNINGMGTYEIYKYPHDSKYDTLIYNTPLKVDQTASVFSDIIEDSTQSYCYYVHRTITTCGGHLDSPDICTIPISNIDVNANPPTLSFEWKEHNTRIKKDEQNNTAGNSRKIKTQINYWIEDNPKPPIKNIKIIGKYEEGIDCGKKYCYQIETEINDFYEQNKFNPAISLSQKRCYDPKEFKPPPLDDLYTTVGQNGAEVIFTDNSPWAANREKYYLYFNQENGYTKADSSLTINPFSFTGASPSDSSLCFKVGFQDICGSVSEPSPEVCTIFLSSQDDITLEWTAETPFSPEALKEYILLEEVALTGTPVETFDHQTYSYAPDLSAREEKIFYRIKATDEKGNISYSNIYELIPEFKIFIPQIFTPNGDGFNDIFKLFGKLGMVSDMLLEITDRWGVKLISFNDKTFEWDGKVNGRPVASGTYHYQLKITLIDGSQYLQSGSLLIIR